MGSLAIDARSVVQLPTGSGKTLVALLVAKRLSDRRFLFVEPTIEALANLVRQARLIGLTVQIEHGQKRSGRSARLVATTYQTALARPRVFRKDLVLFLDECHHVNYQAKKYSALLGDRRWVFGASATPWSKGCIDYFDRRILIEPLSSLIRAGVNCEYEIRDWEEPTPGTFQLIYARECRNHALLQSLRQTDYAICNRNNAHTVIERFRLGRINNIIVNRMMTEGFDLKQIKRIFIDRRVMSRIMLMQMLGRGLRPFNGQTAIIYLRFPDSRARLQQSIRRAA